MRKILAAAAAAAFAGTMFASAPTSADCIEYTSANWRVVAWGPWGPIYAPQDAGVDTNPDHCRSSVDGVVAPIIEEIEGF